MNWEPTNELRWINRSIPQERFHHHSLRETVLQQKWQEAEHRATLDINGFGQVATRYTGRVEWRDVPEVKEGET